MFAKHVTKIEETHMKKPETRALHVVFPLAISTRESTSTAADEYKREYRGRHRGVYARNVRARDS